MLSTKKPTKPERLSRWEDRTRRPLLAAAGVFLLAYAIPILAPGLPEAARATCEALTIAIWALFIADYLVRLGLAPRRLDFIWRHPVDLLVLALPMLRPLRALLAVSAIAREGHILTRGRILVSVAGAVVLVGIVAALAVLESERYAPGGNIRTFGDAIWWSVATITTVGYGDRVPVTFEGKLVGIVLMLTGIALLGVITAAMASWFVEKFGEVKAAEEEAEVSLHEILREIQELRREIHGSGHEHR